MKGLISVALLCFGLLASAEDFVHVSVGERIRVPAVGVTAAYGVDGDCIEVNAEVDAIVVLGQHPCFTHIVVVVGKQVTDLLILVSSRGRNPDEVRRATLQAQHIQELGTLNTYYSSNPGEVETSIELSRSQGKLNTTFGLSVANGYVLSPDARRTAIPYASFRFAGETNSVTLLDSLVDQSPLTIENTTLRGLHIETSTWFVHAGVTSLTGFRQRLYEKDPDLTLDTGYRFSFGSRSSITPSVQWMRASQRYVSGQSGAIGSLLYSYELRQRLNLQLETALGHGVAEAGQIDYTDDSSRLQVRIRNTPLNFPGLSMARPRGFQGNGTFTHSFSHALGLDVSASRDTYALLDRSRQANSTGSAHLQYRFYRHFTINGGAGFSDLARRVETSLSSISVPTGISYDSRRFGTSFQYQFSHNRGQDLGSHSLRDSIRVTIGKTTFNAYASRQSQTPTVNYLLVNLPWLEQALLTAGATANTPEEIQQFLQSNSDLIAGGYVRNLNIGIASLRRQAGAAMHWTSPRNLISTKLEWRWDDYQQLSGNVTSTSGSASVSLRLNRQTDVTLGGSLFNTRSPQGILHAPLLTIGIRRQLGNVPDLMTRFQQRAWIRGTVFDDVDGQGEYDRELLGLGGVTVVLDGTRRTRTDAEGHYSFTSLAEGKHWIAVNYENSAPFQFTTPPQIESDTNSVVNFGIAVRKGVITGTVLNDAQQPLANVVVRITGPTTAEGKTSTSGAFTFSKLDHGSYKVALDVATLPPSHALDADIPHSLVVQPDQPGRVDFVVRALRSVSGTVTCNGEALEASVIELQIDGLPAIVDVRGNFSLRDLTSGRHELLLVNGANQHRSTIDVAPEPSNLHMNLEGCSQ